jgi:hypothetical protein
MSPVARSCEIVPARESGSAALTDTGIRSCRASRNAYNAIPSLRRHRGPWIAAPFPTHATRSLSDDPHR